MARVMIVDDSPTDVLNLRKMLTRAGHTVTAASTGNDALPLIRAELPDCVLMDLVMPGMNGFQATRTLTRDPLTSKIPVIVCSRKDQMTDRVWALRQGARKYLIKPVVESELLAGIRAVLGE